MVQLSRMLMMSLILFASMEPTIVTSILCITNLEDSDEYLEMTKEPNADKMWTLTVHFTSWTVNGTFNVDDYCVNPKPEFKDNRTILNSENNVTAVFRVKLNSFIKGTIEVEHFVQIDDYPNTRIPLNAVEIEFHPVRMRPIGRGYQDAVLPVVSSPRPGDLVSNVHVRGICYAHKCGITPYYLEQELNYYLYIHCDKVQPFAMKPESTLSSGKTHLHTNTCTQ